MIEVLVTLVILLVGLLGLAGVMISSQRAELESYQRVQGLIILQDIVGRINANRNVAACYAFTTNAAAGTPFVGATGTGILSTIPPACTAGTTAQQTRFQNDITAWNTLLSGAAETAGGMSTGAMIGARGCISYDAATELVANNGSTLPGTGIYTITVAWQGLGDTAANTTLLCAQGLYGSETRRRVVSLTMRVGSIGNTN